MGKAIVIDDIAPYLEGTLHDFHVKRIQSIKDLSPAKLVRKNPYLHRSLNLTDATEYINHLMNSFTSSSDEGTFGKLLEKWAIHVCAQAFDGRKSAAEGPDLDFTRDGVRYLVSIKSGPNWGNSSSWSRLEQYLTSAVVRIKQEDHRAAVHGVVGVCYGKKNHTKPWPHLRLYGQDFWELISGSATLYRDLIEPVGLEAERHDEEYQDELIRAKNRLSSFVVQNFVDDGELDWMGIIDFVSKTK